VKIRATTALFVGALAALCSCAAGDDEPAAPTYREPKALRVGKAQRDALCGRKRSDLVTDLFCADDEPSIDSLAQLRAALDLVTFGGMAEEGFAITGHSTSLVSRSVSAINPRIIYMRPPGVRGGELISMAFARGEQFTELVVRDRVSSQLTFYLVTFTQACNDAEGGCLPGDLLTEAVETDWKRLDVYIEDDLVNTPLDCLVCHQPDGPGTPKLLRMQELAPPWNHWFFNLSEGGHAIMDDYLAAKGDEPFAGVAGREVYESNPGLLSSTLFFLGSGQQPNAFVSADIEREVIASAAAKGGNQPMDNSVPGESPTWNAIYERARRGEAISVPYHDVKVTDPVKLARMTQAYTDYREGRITRAELPDIRDVYPDDPTLLARMGFATEPGLKGKDLLLQACAQCHNDRLDQTVSRARFNVDLQGLSQQQKELAAARIMMSPDNPGVMPPARFRSLSDEAKAELIDHIMR
jgi:hypothetical protein